MAVRLTLNLDKVTWSELISFVDSVRAEVDLSSVVEQRVGVSGESSPMALVATIPGNIVRRGPAVIGAQRAASYVSVLEQILVSGGNAGRFMPEMRSLLEELR